MIRRILRCHHPAPGNPKEPKGSTHPQTMKHREMIMLEPSTTPLITEAEIAKRVDELGKQIAEEFANDGTVTVLGLLRGCFIFMADLVRAISRHGGDRLELDFMIVSSYGSGTESSGNIKIERDVRFDIADKRVLIVDDILDTGFTLQRVTQLLAERKPESIKTVVLLDKPSRREVNVGADYTGFSIDNHFVVGYGLDYDHNYRELPYIGRVEESGE
jgi:hypoxanthine phosphoribosyltransferase